MFSVEAWDGQPNPVLDVNLTYQVQQADLSERELAHRRDEAFSLFLRADVDRDRDHAGAAARLVLVVTTFAFSRMRVISR
jgi:hypothetical protein